MKIIPTPQQAWSKCNSCKKILLCKGKSSINKLSRCFFKDLPAPKIKGFESAIHTICGVWYAYKQKADIVHIHAIGPSIAIPFAKLLGLKVVVTHHGPDYDRKNWNFLQNSF